MSEEERSENAAGTREEASSREADEAGGGAAEGRDEADGGAVGDEFSEHLSEEIREELKELDELRNRHLRLAAEFENYRKRTRRELGEARERGQAQLAGRLLDALDDLDRLVETLEEGASEGTLEEGVEMVRRKLWKELSEAGLERIEAEGEAFDPEVHDGLLTVPTEDRDEDGRVSRVLIQGYRLGDRVLRPARVEVKKHAAGRDAGDEGGEA